MPTRPFKLTFTSPSYDLDPSEDAESMALFHRQETFSMFPDKEEAEKRRTAAKRVVGKRNVFDRMINPVFPWVKTTRKKLRKKSVFSQLSHITRGDHYLFLNAAVYSLPLNVAVSLAIFLTAVLVLLDVDGLGDPNVIASGQMLCLGVFSLEFAMRLGVEGSDYFTTTWNQFDFILLVFMYAGWYFNHVAAEALEIQENQAVYGSLRVLRVFRVLKLMHHLALFGPTKELFVFLKTFIEAIPSLGKVYTLMGICIYIMAIFFTQLVGFEDPFLRPYFGTMGHSMVTILACATHDQCHRDVLSPLTYGYGEPPANAQPAVATLLIVTSAVVTWVFLNVAVAILVEKTCSLCTVSVDDEMDKVRSTEKLIAKSIKAIFQAADDDGSGHVEWDEFDRALTLPRVVKKLDLLDISVVDAKQLFFLLDSDKSRSVNLKEWTDGLLRMKGVASSRDLYCMSLRINANIQRAEECIDRVDRMLTYLDMIADRVEAWWYQFEQQAGLRDDCAAQGKLAILRTKEREALMQEAEEAVQKQRAWASQFETAYEYGSGKHAVPAPPPKAVPVPSGAPPSLLQQTMDDAKRRGTLDLQRARAEREKERVEKLQKAKTAKANRSKSSG